MMVPVRVEGLPYDYLFQFDLGSNVTTLYGNPLDALIKKHRGFDRVKNEIIFKELTLFIGNTIAHTQNCHITRNHGDVLNANYLASQSPIRLGTIGADIFQSKILVIDYPNQRFTICDTLPPLLQTSFADITLDNTGRVILPLLIHGKNYRIMFDNGSSLFALITSSDKINLFSTEPGTDTLSVSSWGKTHNIIGRLLKTPFQLANNTFSDIMIYADYRDEARSTNYDAITGNALFWDKVVIIDFKNKRFGIKYPPATSMSN